MKRFGLKRVVEFTALALFVLGFRVFFQELIPLFEEKLNLTFGRFLVKLLSNYPLTLLMLLLDLGVVYSLNRFFRNRNSFEKIVITFFSSALIALLSALWIRIPVWSSFQGLRFFSDIYFNFTLFTSFVFNLVILSLLHLYAYNSNKQQKALNVEIGKKNKARYQYIQLKNQLNPHFLFNSLNVLDYLIFEDQKRASEFVRKLSSVYRYLLKNEELKAVSFAQEIDFVIQYYDLLKERFSDGLFLNIEIPVECYNYHIIPGGMQMLVENAVKHNKICVEEPLNINIYIEDNFIVVKNNLQLRLTTIESAGFGLKSIKSQYLYLYKKDIKVESGKNYFKVSLPIINKL